jgi:hypothetical protein
MRIRDNSAGNNDDGDCTTIPAAKSTQQSTGNNEDMEINRQQRRWRQHNNQPAGTITKQSTCNNEETTALNRQQRRRRLHNNTSSNEYTTINLHNSQEKEKEHNNQPFPHDFNT